MFLAKVLVNRFENKAFPVRMWLDKNDRLDMTLIVSSGFLNSNLTKYLNTSLTKLIFYGLTATLDGISSHIS